MVSACFRSLASLGRVPVFLLLAAPCVSAADSVETVQRAAAEWAKLRSETVRLQTDWSWQRETLEASLTALRARVTTLEQQRDTLQAEIKSGALQSSEIVQRNDEARRGLDTVETRLNTLAGKLVAVRPFLPPRLSEGLELAFKSIQDAQLGAAERMQHVVTIFNRCGAFNKAITFAEQELALDNTGHPRLLEVLYTGLSHAYAYDRSNHTAYFGHPGTSGWTWEPRPDSAGDVEQMLAIYHEESDPTYIVLPAQITEPFTSTSTTTAQR